MFGEILEVARNRDGDYIKTADGNEVPDHEHIARSRLRVDTLKWCAARLAPKKYGEQITHDVKGTGINNFQPQILIQCSSAGEDEKFIDISAAPETAGGSAQQGNGDIVRER